MKVRRDFLLPLILCIQLLILPTGFGLGQSSRIGGTNYALPSSQSVEVTPLLLPGLMAKVEVIQDEFGIPHVFAKTMEDAVFMQGFLQARDRFFQMDVTRRTAEGTLAELLGPGNNNSVLSQDVELRALGLARAAAATLPKLRPETRRLLKAYAKGVNSYLANNPLPAEYQVLKITQKRMWEELDTLSIGKVIAFQLSFGLSDITATLALKAYEAAGKAQGFDGTTLFFQDTFRSAPFDPTFAIPDATGKSMAPESQLQAGEQEKLIRQEQRRWSQNLAKTIKPATLEMARRYLEQISQIPFLANAANLGDRDVGSNWFILSGQHTESGSPMLTSDPHLPLSTPPIWYQIQLNVKGPSEPPLNVIGVSFPGTPGVVLGHNDNIAWGATVTNFDLTDVYQEEIAVGFGGLSIIHNGKKEPVVFRDETFRVNQITTDKNDNILVVPPGSNGVPSTPFATVPLRNNGPIISVDLESGTALSVQYVGFGPTFEVEAILEFDRAKSVKDFQKALQFIDFGTQNWSVVSTSGDIAYFTSGEVPLREDLEMGKVNGAPPFFIRDGRGGNDWQPLRKRQPHQALPTDILPFAELPQVINPARGFVVSANNDQIGITANNNPLERKRPNGGIYYLSPFFANGSRAARLTRDIEAAINSGTKISIEQARRFQGSVQMRDAEILMPFIRQAFENAQKPDAPPELAALAADAGVSEAMARFATWNFTTPTGLRAGYDAFVPHDQRDPTETEIANSVSTTIYSLWRSQIIGNTLDATLASLKLQTVDGQLALAALRNLLDNFPTRKGVGQSGVSFFSVPSLSGASPEAQRDFIILQSLRQALDLLAGPDFQTAFNGSTRQSDYRWGILHRIIFASSLGANSEFSIPSEKSNFHSPIPGLPGLPRDGGLEVPNASSHNVRARSVNGFMFSGGPSQRLTVAMKPGAIEAVNAIPGGQSGLLTSQFRDNLLNFWLVCNVYPFISDKKQLLDRGAELLVFQPER